MLKRLLGRLEYLEVPNKQLGPNKRVGWKTLPHLHSKSEKP